MVKTNRQGLLLLGKIALPYFLISFSYVSIIIFLERLASDYLFKVSAQIGSLFGLAIAFFLGFRMNAGYDRWWEARKILGELTNNSRSFAAKLYAYYQNPKHLNEPQKAINRFEALMEMLMAYIAQFSYEIRGSRKQRQWRPILEQAGVDIDHKISNELLLAIIQRIDRDFCAQSNIEKSDLMQLCNRFYEIQGKAERIRNTPFLKIYTALTRIIIWFYVFLLPLFVGDLNFGNEQPYFEYLAVPILSVLSTTFLTINRLATLYSEPFAREPTSMLVEEMCENLQKDCLEVKRKFLERMA
jgi:putative membrane protein